MNNDLTQYINDHLVESSASLLLIQKLADSHEGPGARGFFLNLHDAVQADQALLINLLVRIGQKPTTLNERTVGMDSCSSRINLWWQEIEPGNRDLFEALEMLVLGVESKRLLWGALREIAVWFHEWDGIDFDALDLRAIQQRDGIEFWRIREGVDILTDVKRRIEFQVI